MTFKNKALRAGLYSSAAIAAFVAFDMAAQAGTLTVGTITYSALSVSANSNSVSLPPLTYVYGSAATSAIVASGDTLVVTFPSGITFSTNPTATFNNDTSSGSPSGISPTYSSNTITVTVASGASSGATLTAANVPNVQISGLVIAGASALTSDYTGSTSVTNFPVTAKLTSGTASVSDSSAVTMNNTTVAGAVGITSVTGVTLTAASATAVNIDLGSPNLGTKFGSLGSLSVATAAALASSVTLAPGTAYQASNSSVVYTNSQAVTLSITGTYGSPIASAYLAPSSSTACTATAPSSAVTSSTVGATSITFSGTTTTQFGPLCVVAGGSSVLNDNSSSSNIPKLKGVVGSLNTATITLTNAGYGFANGAQKFLPYLVGSAGGYTSIIRVINSDTTNPLSLFISTTDESNNTVAYQSTAVTTVAANTSKTFTLEGLAPTGTTLIAPGARGYGKLLIAGSTSVAIQSYLLQPGNLLLNVGAASAQSSATASSNAVSY